MPSIEKNSDDWREIRSRVDSIANAIFLIAGGALSLSITVMVGDPNSAFLADDVAAKVIPAWYFLLAAVLLLLFLKAYLIFEAYLLQFHTGFVDKNIKALNRVGWLIGILGFFSFVIGLTLLVAGAAQAIG